MKDGILLHEGRRGGASARGDSRAMRCREKKEGCTAIRSRRLESRVKGFLRGVLAIAKKECNLNKDSSKQWGGNRGKKSLA